MKNLKQLPHESGIKNLAKNMGYQEQLFQE